MRKAFLGLIITIMLSAGCAAVKPIKNGGTAPDFSLATLSGAHVRMSGLYGRRVLLCFATISCKGCREELQTLKKLYEQYPDLNVVVIGKGFGEWKGEISDWNEYVVNQGLEYQVVMDRSGLVFAQYQVPSVPSLVFVDNAGIITVGHAGPMAAVATDQALRTIGIAVP